MTLRFKSGMAEATRLTRQGRLSEALSVLRGALSGTVPGSANQAGDRPSERAPAGRFRFPSRPATPARPGVVPPVPEGARFETRSFTGPGGTRTYRLFVPSRPAAGGLPLLVMLHGCTQTPDDFAAGTRMNLLAEEHGLAVVYPAQSDAANASLCWNWFNAGNQARDRGEAALIAGIARAAMAEVAVANGRVYVAGLSAGGAAAAIMAAAYPDLFAAAAVHSGLPVGAARTMTNAFSAMKKGAGTTPKAGSGVPMIVFHGDADSTVVPVNGVQVIDQALAGDPLETRVEHGTSAAGVRFTRTIHALAGGSPRHEHWLVHGLGHAWSGGSADGSYTAPQGPDASREMLRFFLSHRTGKPA